MKYLLLLLLPISTCVPAAAQDSLFTLVKDTTVNIPDYGGISALEYMPGNVLSVLFKGKHYASGLLFVTDHHPNQGGGSIAFIDIATKPAPKDSSLAFIDTNTKVAAVGNLGSLRDIESIRYHPGLNRIYYSWETDMESGVGYFKPDDSKKRNFPLITFNARKNNPLITKNRGVEGIAITDDHKLWMAFESGGSTQCETTQLPFYRFSFNNDKQEYDTSGKEIFLYPLDRCQYYDDNDKMDENLGNGVSEILKIEGYPNRLLVLERSFNGKKGHSLLYIARIDPSSNLLYKYPVYEFKPPSDNLEGMAWGKDSDGNPVLYIVSDNNFSPRQVNRILILKLNKDALQNY